MSDFFTKTTKYDDIINLPRHISVKHSHMSMHDRAAQFAPFAALTGYDAAVNETARLTDSRFDLDEDELDTLDYKLQQLQLHIHEQPRVTVTYFTPDKRKQGGSYHTICGRLTRIDANLGTIVLSDVNDTLIPSEIAADVLESIAEKTRGVFSIDLGTILDITTE